MKNLTLLVLLLSAALTYSQTEQKTEYQKGIEALQNNKVEDAVKLFENSAKTEKNSEAYFELSKIAAFDTTVNSYNKAREQIKEAIKLDKKNIKYYMHFAELLKVLFKINHFDKDALLRAEDQYNTVIEIDSTFAPAYYELGKLYERYFFEYYGGEEVKLDYDNEDKNPFAWKNLYYKKNKIKFYKEDDVKEKWNSFVNDLFDEGSYASLKMNKEAVRIFQKGLYYFTKTAEYDSLNINAFFKPAMMNSLIKNYSAAVEFLNHGSKEFLVNPDYNLAYGYNYYKLRDFEKSQKYFNDAFRFMDNDKRYVYKIGSVLEILNPSFAEKLANYDRRSQEAILNQYWEIKDPLLLTKENERLLEHYARVFYSDYFLSSYDPYVYFPNEIDHQGWNTERGKAALRYGEPIERKILLPTDQISKRSDYWDYGDFKLSFNEIAQRNIYKMAGYDFINQKGHFSSDSKFSYDQLIDITPERYIPGFKGPLLNLPFKVYQFKELNNTGLYLSYAIPKDDSISSYSHKYGVFLFDSRMKPLYKYESSVPGVSKDLLVSLNKDSSIYVQTVSNKLKPGEGNMNFEIIRDEDGAVFYTKGKLDVKNFESNQLAISDILLASNIKIEDESGTNIKRGIYNILPNPSNTFYEESFPYLYYEVYNLKLGENNLTDFEQEITIQEFDEDNKLSDILNSLGDLIGLDSKGSELTTSANYSTIEKDPKIYLQLDFSSYDPGEYLITVSVKDKISGETSASNIKLSWKEE